MDLIDRKALLEKTKKLESYLVVCKDFFSREDLIKIVNLYCERWRNIINQEPAYNIAEMCGQLLGKAIEDMLKTESLPMNAEEKEE